MWNTWNRDYINSIMQCLVTNVVIVENQCLVISVNHIQVSHDCMYTYFFLLYCVTQLFMMISEYTMCNTVHLRQNYLHFHGCGF